MTSTSLHKKLFQAYALQAVLISSATLLSVFIAAYVLEHLLIHRALQQEAEYFWSNTTTNHPLPNTRNLRAFITDDQNNKSLPDQLKNLQTGFGRLNWQQQQVIYLVSKHNQQTLYLLFMQENVNKLALYFGVLPLSLLLLIFYIFMWFSYQQSKRALSPLTQLANRVSAYRFSENTLPELNLDDLKPQADTEALSLIRALELFNQQLRDYIDRERRFNRDASHELRTPLALLQASVDVIQQNAKIHPLSLKAQHHIDKIQNTLVSMRSLLEALLLLARDIGYKLPSEPIIINSIIDTWKQKNSTEILQKNLQVEIHENARCSLIAPPTVLQILLDNILNNSLKYTQTGHIKITIHAQRVTVKDTGIGIKPEDLPQVFTPFFRATDSFSLNSELEPVYPQKTELAASTTWANHSSSRIGFGLGLSIVKRLCDQFNWKISISSMYGKGTEVLLVFNNESFRSAKDQQKNFMEKSL